MRSRASFAAWGLMATAMAVAYGPLLAGLAAQWFADDQYSHGVLVVPLSSWFAWRRRAALAAAPRRPTSWGFAVVACGLLLLSAGTLGAELFLARISLVSVIAGSVLALLGMPSLRVLAFPIAFLLLMIPLPAIVFNELTVPLQLLASSVGESILRLADVPVFREGNILELARVRLEVADACSGIRSLFSLLAVALVLGEMRDVPRIARAALALMTMPVAIAANALRVAVTGVAAQAIGPAAAEGFLHSLSGWLVFMFAIGVLLGIQRLSPRRLKTPAVPSMAHA
jgi:exosortase